MNPPSMLGNKCLIPPPLVDGPGDGNGCCGMPTNFAYAVQGCSNANQLPVRCPDGNKVERTKPCLPRKNPFPVNFQNDWRSLYNTDFVTKLSDRRKMLRPARTAWKTEGAQQTWDSVYREAYIPYPPQPCNNEKKWYREKNYLPNPHPMNAMTTYNRDYYKKDGDPAKSAKQKPKLEAYPPPLDDVTTYRDAFIGYDLSKMECKEKRKCGLESIPCVPFDGMSTYKRDFNNLELVRPNIVKASRFRPKPTHKFDDRTIYRCSFEPFYYCGDTPGCIPGPDYDNMYLRDACPQSRI